MIRKVNKFSKTSFSIIAVILLVLVNIWTIRLPEVKADGGPGANDIILIEVENENYYRHSIQILNDNGIAEVIKAHPSIGGYNFFDNRIILYEGTYKYYFRARSTIGSTISIGVYDSTTGDLNFKEEFLLSKEYRWYMSDNFQISSSPQEVNVWAHTRYFAEYIDKIMLIRWKDDFDQKISGTFGQLNMNQVISDPTVDSDGDGILDQPSGSSTEDQEFNENAWWIEAEHVRLANNVNVVLQKDASNGKAISVRGDLKQSQAIWDPVYGTSYGVIPLLKYDVNSYPVFKDGDEYQLFVRAKGPENAFFYMEVGDESTRHLVMNQGNNNVYLHDKEYRWFASPKFTTDGMNLDMFIQIFSIPPQSIPVGDCWIVPGIFFDKLMLLRTKTGSGVKTSFQYGLLTDPFDPDTDLDGRNDGLERKNGLYCFEAEHWASTNQIKFNRPLASSSQTIKRVGGSPTADPLMVTIKSNSVSDDIFDEMGLGNNEEYRLYLRARTESTILPSTDKIEVDILFTDSTTDKPQFTVANIYRWFVTPVYDFSTISSIRIESSTSDNVLLDKFMLVKKDSVIEGQTSDALDPNMDWDKISDGKEISDDVFWIEAEFSKSRYTTGIGSGMNTNDGEGGNSGGFFLEGEVSANYDRGVTSGIYQLYFRAKYDFTSLAPNSVPFSVSIPNTNIQNILYILRNTYEWYSTPEFTFGGSLITVEFTNLDSSSRSMLDKFMLVRRTDLSSNPTDKTRGIVPTDPLDPDMDWDNIIDGDEYSSDLRWFQAEHYIDPGLFPTEDSGSSNCYCIWSDQNENNLFNININLPPGEYHYLISAKCKPDASGVKLNLKVDYTGGQEVFNQYLISDYKWYDCITFKLLNTQIITLSGSCVVPSGREIFVDKVLLVKTINENKYSTGLKVGKLLGPRYGGIYLAVPGRISDAFDDDSDGDSYSDYDELNGITAGGGEYILDPLNSDTDGDNLLDNIEISSTLGTDPTMADSDGDLIPDGWIDGWGCNLVTYICEMGTKDGYKFNGINTNYVYLEYENFNRDGVVGLTSGFYTETSPIKIDTDNDGIYDQIEYILGVTPWDKDTDNDGIKDGVECKISGNYLINNPLLNMANNFDFDNDHLNDGLEMGYYRTPDSITTDNVIEDIEAASENVYGTNPSVFGTGDADSGGSKTDPRDTDTDGDELPDGWIDYNLNGLRDLGEFEDFDLNGKIMTGNPQGWDTTGLNTATYASQTFYDETDPQKSDTDDDDVIDSIEIFDSPPTNPLITSSNNLDDDADGLSNNYEESIIYSESYIDWNNDDTTDYKTDPGSATDPNYDNEAAADTDSDGLLDGEELAEAGDFEGTHPLNPDSDRDGIPDCREGNGVDEFWHDDSDDQNGMNALDTDSDNDGLYDYEEARVSFRTNVFDGDYMNTDEYLWIALETDPDNNQLEIFWREEYEYTGDPITTSITTTPENYPVRVIDDTEYSVYIDYSVGETEYKPIYRIDEDKLESITTNIPDQSIYPSQHPIGEISPYLFFQTWNWYSDPTNKDTDNDGLLDYDEINIYYTNPSLTDTDEDGASDDLELSLGWDPNDEYGDFDEDGIIDIQEDKNQNGLYEKLGPDSVFGTLDDETDPNNPDTDADGLLDGWEKTYHYKDASYECLNPLKEDSNADGIFDGEETVDIIWDTDLNKFYYFDDYLSNLNEFIYGTSPRFKDSDFDGYYDGEEVIECDGKVVMISDPADYRSTADDTDGDASDWIDNDGDGESYSPDSFEDGSNGHPKDGIYQFGENVGNDRTYGDWIDLDMALIDDVNNDDDDYTDEGIDEPGETDVAPYNCEGYDRWDADNDNDGLTNEYEINWDGNSEYDPESDLNPVRSDTDGDGVNDKDEVDYGFNPLVPEYDHDFDGLEDALEIEYGFDPMNPDTNGNLFTDYEEYMDWENKIYDKDIYKCLIKGMLDSDGDGHNDWLEEQHGSDKNDPNSPISAWVVNVHKNEWDTAAERIELIGRIKESGAMYIRTDFKVEHIIDENSNLLNDFIVYKLFIEEAYKNGLGVIPILKLEDSGWCMQAYKDSLELLNSPEERDRSFDKFKVGWEKFVEIIAKNNGPMLNYYEILNEENHIAHQQICTVLEVMVFKWTYWTLHDYNDYRFKTIVNVHASGYAEEWIDLLAGTGWESRLQYWCDNGGDYIDILAIDSYPGTWEVDMGGFPDLPNLINLCNNNGKMAAIMETGYSTYESLAGPIWHNQNDQKQFIINKFPIIRSLVNSQNINHPDNRFLFSTWYELRDGGGPGGGIIETEANFGIYLNDWTPKSGYNDFVQQIGLFG